MHSTARHIRVSSTVPSTSVSLVRSREISRVASFDIPKSATRPTSIDAVSTRT